jgi:hypothetical protein
MLKQGMQQFGLVEIVLYHLGVRHLTGWLWQFVSFRAFVCWLIVSAPLPGRVKRFCMTETPWLIGMREFYLSTGDYAAASVFEKALREGVEVPL